jgi:hypothetical protein
MTVYRLRHEIRPAVGVDWHIGGARSTSLIRHNAWSRKLMAHQRVNSYLSSGLLVFVNFFERGYTFANPILKRTNNVWSSEQSCHVPCSPYRTLNSGKQSTCRYIKRHSRSHVCVTRVTLWQLRKRRRTSVSGADGICGATVTRILNIFHRRRFNFAMFNWVNR